MPHPRQARLLEVRNMANVLQESSRLLTAAEYAALGEDAPLRRVELLEGNLVMSANPLVPGSGYQDDGAVTGIFTAPAPWPVRVDLAALAERPAEI